jgi:HEAT repeat protein
VSGEDDQGPKRLPLFEFGKGRPGIRPVPLARPAPTPPPELEPAAHRSLGPPDGRVEPAPVDTSLALGPAGQRALGHPDGRFEPARPPPAPLEQPLPPPEPARTPARGVPVPSWPPPDPARTPAQGVPVASWGAGTPAKTPSHGIPAVTRATPAPLRSPAQGVQAVGWPQDSLRSPASGVPRVEVPGYRAEPDPVYPFEPGRPRPEEFKHPLSPDVARWMQVFLRAVRGRRLYPLNNPVLRGYLEQAHEGLRALLERQPAVIFRVREDRLFFEGDAVMVDPDRVEGLPFVLFTSAIQQLEFQRGIGLAELASFTELLSRDYNSEAHAGEDLVTGLWRADLHHVVYSVIDVYSIDEAQLSAVDPSALVVDDEMRRIRAELARIARALRGQPLQGDLPSLEGVEHHDPLLAQVDVEGAEQDPAAWDPKALQLFAGQVLGSEALRLELSSKDEHEALVGRLTELLVSAMRAEGEAPEDTPGWRLLLTLLDAVLHGRQFEEALKLTDLLTGHLLAQPRAEDRALATRLLEYLGSPAAVSIILQVMEATADPVETKAALELLGRLGRHAFRAALMHLGHMEQAHARRQVVELFGPHMADDPGAVVEIVRVARPEVLRDILGLGEALPAPLASDLVWVGADHLDGAVRARAVALLRGFSGTRADQLVARFLQDRDPLVRTAALRAAAHRKSQVVLDALVATLKRPDLDDVEPGELKSVLAALVAVGGNKATPLLSRLLNDSGALGLRRHGTEVQVAVAHALGMLGSPEAKAALQSGTKTLNRRVKAACNAALTARSAGPLHLDLPARFGELEMRPASLDRPPLPVALGPGPVTAAPPRAEGRLAGIPMAERTAPTSRPPVASALDTFPPFASPPGALRVDPPADRAPTVRAPPGPPPPAELPLLDPAALRLASEITAPQDPAQDADLPLLEAETLPAHPAVEAAPVPSVSPGLSALVDDLMAPPPRRPAAPPRLPTNALVELSDEEGDA